MSYVTEIILICACDDNGCQDINKFIPGHDCVFGLVSIAHPKLPPYWTGGTKVFASEVYIGAINWLPSVDEFIRFLRTIEWDCPDSVQLVLREPDGICFKLIDVFSDWITT